MAEAGAGAPVARPPVPFALPVLQPSPTLEWFQSQPVLGLRLPCGDAVQVALHGAQVLSWVSGGRERLYLSPKALLDGRSAIRGGVPLCFPQFNQRGPLPKHGFARNLPWTVVPAAGLAGNPAGSPADAASLSLRLHDTEATRALWPQAFETTLTVALQPGRLQITLAVHNPGGSPLHFTGALHTYLAVDDIAVVRLDGLQGRPRWDALTDRQGQDDREIVFAGAFDRVYAAASAPLTLHDGAHDLQIVQSASFTDTVVWSPGAALCRRLGDLPADGFTRMLCVEAAQVQAPVEVAAGDTWLGWQRLIVL